MATPSTKAAITIILDQPSQTARQTGNSRTEHASCEINGMPYHAKSRTGAVCELCRVLVVAGVEDGPWQAYRTGRLVMFGRSVHALASRTVSEGDKRPPRFAMWRPYPEREMEAEL